LIDQRRPPDYNDGVQLILLFLLSLGIANIYNFNVSLGSVASGMRASSIGARTVPGDEKVPAFVFTKYPPITGWKATFLNCANTLKDCEVRLNARGASAFPRNSAPERRYDLGFSLNADGTMRVRCFRDTCLVRYLKNRQEQPSVSLKYGESKSLPVNIDIQLR